MFFVIPEMPSKTFVMVKKLPDHLKGGTEKERGRLRTRVRGKETALYLKQGDIFKIILNKYFT